MRLNDAVEVLRSLAPERLSEDWDNVGLLVGDPSWRLRRALLCIDLTESVLAEAIEQKADLIVAYHPPIFSALPALTSADLKQRIILAAASRRIAIYSPHTALDSAPAGVNDWLAQGIGPGVIRALRPLRDAVETAYKLVTFVPHEVADSLRTALASTGAGQIGDYTNCSFGSHGEGTFVGGNSTKPAIGRRGHLERVAELRLEMVCGSGQLADVVAALRKAHPYEEPAFDLYRLEPTPIDATVGQGRVIVLHRSLSVPTLVRRLKKYLGLRQLEVAVPDPMRPLVQVAVCAGAGGSLLEHAGPIDAFVTGEMRHHQVLAACADGVTVILAGHSQTERPYLPVYRDRIVQLLGQKVMWSISTVDRPPCVKM